MAHKYTNFTGWLFTSSGTVPTCFVDAYFHLGPETALEDTDDTIQPGELRLEAVSSEHITVRGKSLNGIVHQQLLPVRKEGIPNILGGQRIYSSADGGSCIWANQEKLITEGDLAAMQSLLPLFFEPALAVFEDPAPETAAVYKFASGYNCDCSFDADNNQIIFAAGPGRGLGIAEILPSGWDTSVTEGVTSINGITPADGGIKLSGSGDINLFISGGV